VALLEERQRRERDEDFQVYAAENLRIRTKAGGTAPFVLNAAQLHVHRRLEDQKRRTGKVRALVLKARQEGISTYVEGRYYWQASRRRGVRVFILAHEQPASDNLFAIVNRFHDNNPHAPRTRAANAKELDFADLDSSYRVATAGTKAVGRSDTLQFFHGSEVAFWPNADDHMAGSVQAVADSPGTEIILESTARGVGNLFHAKWQEAEAGTGEYEAIFIPWHWQQEYRKALPAGFTLTDEEAEYKALYQLDDEQMAWRRAKIADLGEAVFKQEYPAVAAEAFQNTGTDSFIPSDLVVAARKGSHEGIGPLVIGADPARFGDDRFSVIRRKGRKAFNLESRLKLDSVTAANWLKQIIDTEKPERMFIDAGGIGGAVIDMLNSWGKPYVDVVKGVNFGGEPMEPVIILPDGTKRPGPKNRRAEMWSRSRDWLKTVGGVQIPDTDSLQADGCAPGYSYDLNQRLMLESKDQMRARGIRSPDEWDALALTFAEPVYEKKPKKPVPAPYLGADGWMA